MSNSEAHFFERINEEFTWHNTASLENIPRDVMYVVQDVVTAMQNVYGDNGALYLHGSTVSGGFRDGASDIDAIWFAYDELPDDHRERRIAELEKVETRGVVGYLDAIAMPVSEMGNAGRKSQIFACAFNGAKIAGARDIEFSGYLPQTKGDYFSCQYARFAYIIQLCREGYELDTLEHRSPRSLAKSLARAIFHEAYFRGSPYEQATTKMQAVLVDNGFSSESAEFGKYMALSQRTMNESEKQKVFARAEKLVPIFRKIVESNASPYGLWVKDWLEQQS